MESRWEDLPTDNLDALLVRARRQAVGEIGSDELVFMDTELETEGSERLWRQ